MPMRARRSALVGPLAKTRPTCRRGAYLYVRATERLRGETSSDRPPGGGAAGLRRGRRSEVKSVRTCGILTGVHTPGELDQERERRASSRGGGGGGFACTCRTRKAWERRDWPARLCMVEGGGREVFPGRRGLSLNVHLQSKDAATRRVSVCVVGAATVPMP
jgi:hypothetical protein